MAILIGCVISLAAPFLAQASAGRAPPPTGSNPRDAISGGTIAANQPTSLETAQPTDDLPLVPEPLPEKPLANSIQVELRAPRMSVPVGSEVLVDFVVWNKTEEPVRLTVPGTLVGKERYDYGIGLPLEHVFSGAGFRALEIYSDQYPQIGERVTRKPDYPVPLVTLAPFATIGLRFDISRFYPGMHQSGLYELRWKPYGGAVEAAPLIIEVVQYKQVVLDTDYGAMTIRLLYDKAPRHVANFLDLVEHRFYNGRTFHVVFPSQFILGGCPIGDGTGKRPDGVCLAPEFNDTAFQVGTVGMALIEGDAGSASCQFFICLSRQPAWDGRYTAFGQITGPQSLAVLQKLGEVAVDPSSHRPVKPLTIKTVTAANVPFTPKAVP